MATVGKSSSSLEPRYTGLPRRYEETKPALTQGFTHHSILDIGHKLHSKVQLTVEQQRDLAVQEAEAQVWEEAETVKQEAVEAALQHAQTEKEREIKNIRKQYEKELKEEGLRVEGEMNKRMLQQLKKERQEAEEKLHDSLRKAQEEFAVQKVSAVKAAQDEERQAAAAQADRVAQMKADEAAETAKAADEDKKKALSNQHDQFQKDLAAAIARTREEEEKKHARHLASLQAEHDHELAQMRKVLKSRELELRQITKQLDDMTSLKTKLEGDLLEMRQEFTRFAERCSGFQEGQADFLLAGIN
ncbi:hypothetical protein Bbelb_315440 [Branchiostoma belcheri]|nr:hypothetical protein Bbelb_315440 [Branchiostoma belcheri]